ncbi:APH-domain-containing protein [Penicillium longicatenatum]|uniref:APH-domain-containing protein n=1 Tax=Penicillium longicatenatum TaxID=1561947 RepID=UPI002547B4FB|nr:APH-domain-containing protein [Penicillium longicatenatum]KAJ5660934.1 APH-domain-containing protein [Penicillium longicatenatum]
MSPPIFQPIDIVALEKYLSQNIPHVQGPIWVTQLGISKSSPTYFIKDRAGNQLVMRKYPPGSSVANTTHRLERQYRALRALENSNIPVPKPYCLCEDPSILGTSFSIVEFLDGRTFNDPSLPGFSPRERHEIWHEVMTILATLHNVNIDVVGLDSFGHRSGYYRRQLQNLKDSELSQRVLIDSKTHRPVGKVPGIDEMIQFFSDGDYQPRNRASLIHGDFKLKNIVFHKTEPRVIGILNWESSTIGHPLSDLASLLQPWTIAEMSSSAAETLSLPSRSPAGVVGLPSITECLAWYSRVAGWNPQAEIMWANSFALFKMSVLRQGINARFAVQRNSSTADVQAGRGTSVCAALTLRMISRMRDIHVHTRARL